MITSRLAVLICTLTALPFAAPAESLYYDVPVTVYNYANKEPGCGNVLSYLSANQPVSNTLATTITGQLLSISGDTTTPALQLIVMANRYTANFRLHRQDMPPEARVAFPQSGHLDLVPNFGLGGFSKGAQVSVLFDLLTPTGKPWGKQYYFRDAVNKPLGNYSVAALPRTSSSTTVSVTLDADGGFFSPSKIIMEKDTANISPAYSRFEITDAQTGVRKLHEFHTRNNDDSASSTTVPFLLDWNTSHPDVAIYSGRFVTAGGKITGPMAFHMGYEPTLVLDSTGNRFDYTTSADGSFRIARNIKSPLDFPGFTLGNDATHPNRSMIFFRESGKRHSRIIDSGVPLTITLRESTTVTVTLLDEHGKPVQEPPAPPKLDEPFTGGFPIMEIDANRYVYNQAVVAMPDTQPGTYKPVALSVPGRYMAHTYGYVYTPQDVTADTKEVAFKPLLADFTLTGRVETPSGEPVKDALVAVDSGFSRMPAVHGLSENPYTTLNDFFTETQGDFQKARCYLTRTDANGQYTISGNSLGKGARLLVVTAEEVLDEVHPFKFNMHDLPSAENRVSGNHTLPTVVLARAAHVTFTLPSDPNDKGPREGLSDQAPSIGLLQGDDATTSPAKPDLGFSVKNSTWARQIKFLAENQWSVNVPSETTFTLTIVSYGPLARHRAIVSEPLQPGETRDITDLLTPVPPDSEKHRLTNTNPVTRITAD